MPSFTLAGALISCLIAAAQCRPSRSGVLQSPGDSEQRLTSAAHQDRVAFLPGWGEPDGLFAGQACIFLRHAHMVSHDLEPTAVLWGLHSNGRMRQQGRKQLWAHWKGHFAALRQAPLSSCRYVTVDEDAGRALYYVFQESLGKPDSDPLVLWLNGVSICSLAHSGCTRHAVAHG